ncbi:MAG: response regulator transcription factor [Actinomycetaceae bacterium]|nr:response regulator transcription factor [Actinomycetaceae bacterium]
MTKILVVEDEVAYRDPLTFRLEQDGFTVMVAEDGLEAVRMCDESGLDIDLVLLDLMLPGMSGTEVCRHLVEHHPRMGVIMVTAKDDEIDTIVGLELGADDYVTKPYSYRELLARMRSVLRRRAVAAEPQTLEALDDRDILEVGTLVMDMDAHELRVGQSVVDLPLREFELLQYLMENAGRALTRAQILDRVWGFDFEGDPKTLDVHIKRLRSRIEEDPANPERIQTVRGVGYKLAGA